MSLRSASSPYGLQTFATLLICRYRVSSGSMASSRSHQHISSGVGLSNFRYGFGSSIHQASNISSGNSIKMMESKMEPKATLKVQPSDPDPPRGNIFSWVKWVLGSILPIMFSFWSKKQNNMLKLEDKVAEVVKEAEEVAEVIEKVASTTEKLSAEVAEKLDNGELKEVALMVEHVSTVIAKDARMTQDFVHKVGDLKRDLTDLEAMVEPVIDEIKHKN